MLAGARTSIRKRRLDRGYAGSVLGEKALHSYLVNEIQEVYRLQGANIGQVAFEK